MSLATVNSNTRLTSKRAAPDDAPPPDIYQFKLVDVLDYIEGDYKGKPNAQFVLEFAMLDWDDKTGNPYKIRGYYAPKIHYVPPKTTSGSYREPDLYLMLKAINGGVPWDLSEFEDENGDADYTVQDVLDILNDIVAAGNGVFRAQTESNEEGWARIKKATALPLRVAKKQPKASARVITEDDDADEDLG